MFIIAVSENGSFAKKKVYNQEKNQETERFS